MKNGEALIPLLNDPSFDHEFQMFIAGAGRLLTDQGDWRSDGLGDWLDLLRRDEPLS